ncbi:hypothetical protein ATCC90586_010139 [Pythium insidiosum]|nr:hypothetical protein ATCC90586_010139 [Pythium insidiosum]
MASGIVMAANVNVNSMECSARVSPRPKRVDPATSNRRWQVVANGSGDPSRISPLSGLSPARGLSATASDARSVWNRLFPGKPRSPFKSARADAEDERAEADEDQRDGRPQQQQHQQRTSVVPRLMRRALSVDASLPHRRRSGAAAPVRRVSMQAALSSARATATTLEYGEREEGEEEEEEETAEDQQGQAHEDDDERGDETQQLREQVALLLRSLEEEKKRRTSEQKLMQEKILELQSVIRRNLPEHQRELEQRVQCTPAPRAPQPRCLDRRCQPPSDDEDTDDVESVDAERGSDTSQLRWSDIGSQSMRSDTPEDDRSVGLKMRQQLTLMRAKMHATVLEARREAQYVHPKQAGTQAHAS